MDVTARIQELEKLIADAKQTYYNNKGGDSVSDEVYDAWVDELAELDSINRLVVSVGVAPVSEWKKVSHSSPMGSLNKVNDLAEMTEWVNHYAPGETLLTTEKMDGISLQIKYTNGKLSLAATRGDGYIGEDITVNAKKMKGVPHTLPRGLSCELRGEIVLRKSDHELHFKDDYANTRNAASGIAKRYDGRGCEHLSVYLYQIVSGLKFETEEQQFKTLGELGFLTPNWYMTGMWLGVKTPHDLWVEYQQTKRNELDYEIDGLVVRINDVEKQFALGEKDLRPVGAVAFKFAAITRETVVRGLSWQTGGTGRITPVAQFDPVNLLGAKVENASVYNYKYITDLGLDVGSRVLVARANDVIPRVVSVVRGTGTTAPSATHCESCSAPTGWDGEYLVCPNYNCPAQVVGRLSQWIKSLNVLEWGDTLLERVASTGLAKTVPDLYRLSEEQLAGLDRMGEKLAAKLLSNLHAKKTLPLEVILGSLSIPGVAVSTAKAVVVAGYDDFSKIRAAGVGNLTKVPGLGPMKARSLSGWLETNEALLQDLLSVVEVQERVKGKFTGLTFCFTGEMKNKRGDLENKVKAAGGEVKSSVTKKLSYLVFADTSTTKATKARSYGVKCISEDDFLALVE